MYPKKLNLNQQQIINEFAEHLENLNPGEYIIIKHDDPQELATRRYLCYVWLSPQHTNTKSYFVIKNLDSKSFMIKRRDESPAEILTKPNDIENFVKTELLECLHEDDVIEIINEKFTDSKLRYKAFQKWESLCRR